MKGRANAAPRPAPRPDVALRARAPRPPRAARVGQVPSQRSVDPLEGAPLGLLVWLGDGKKESAEAMLDAWKSVCRRDGLVLLMPEPGDKAAWSTDDMEYLAKLLQMAVGRFSV